MLGSTSPIYEVVSGQIRLGLQDEFFRLHREMFAPIMQDAGIEPVLLLVTEVGQYLRFLDIYRYPSLEEYGKRTDALLHDKRVKEYYSRIGECVHGSIQVELALEFPHMRGILRDDSSI
jgi:hypothetical protein